MLAILEFLISLLFFAVLTSVVFFLPGPLEDMKAEVSRQRAVEGRQVVLPICTIRCLARAFRSLLPDFSTDSIFYSPRLHFQFEDQPAARINF